MLLTTRKHFKSAPAIFFETALSLTVLRYLDEHQDSLSARIKEVLSIPLDTGVDFLMSSCKKACRYHFIKGYVGAPMHFAYATDMILS